MEKKLPKNWVETEFGNYIFLKNGYAYKTEQFTTEGIPILKISNITNDGKIDLSQTQFVNEKYLNPNFLISKEDILIAMSGATTGKYGVYNGNETLLQNQRVGNIKLHFEKLGNKRFVFYLIGFLKKEIEEKAYGGAQPNISPKLIEEILIPLPPLPEQERIVAKLDLLFAQHEKIKTSLEKIPQILKDFRQQILTQAVTGKLTEEWRKGKDLGEWKETKVGNFVEEVKERVDPEVTPLQKYVGLEHIQKDGGLIGVGISSDVKSLKTLFKKDDVLYGKLRPYLNKHFVVDFDGICSTDILAYRAKNVYYAHFFNFYLGESNVILALNSLSKGINLPRISSRDLNNLMIRIPKQIEIEEIVSRVESLFSKIDAIELRYQKLKEKIDQFPQTILHKAFKGELVPQLPTDGDAKDLLKEILALKKEGKKK